MTKSKRRKLEKIKAPVTIVIFKNVTTVLILKTCFDVANIIISYIKFEKKPLDYITTKRNVHT